MAANDMDIMAANDFIYDDLHNDEDSSYEHEDFLDSYGKFFLSIFLLIYKQTNQNKKNFLIYR